MPDPLMYQQEHFVVLETNQPEQFLTKSELQQKLQGILEEMSPQDLPLDLQQFDSIAAQSEHLLDTTCELDVGAGEYLQWYAVRLEK
ncbi:chlororespiratory reduction protein 7 [Calothrix rhizosoleniae]|uniref:chlororespiratory reduction protein 7 n=1 Tax=Calothrix rhizosoleniae TaxID=888997 RepID=UPI000B4972DE|nr:chlororespiratory reduction protein 7 [Calothrix rhizosoleniae]